MTTKRQKILTETLNSLAPMMPLIDAEAVRLIADKKKLRALPAQVSAWLALTTHIRHVHTDYDALLAEGYDRDSARHFVLDAINEVLERWGGTRFLDESDVDPFESHNL